MTSIGSNVRILTDVMAVLPRPKPAMLPPLCCWALPLSVPLVMGTERYGDTGLGATRVVTGRGGASVELPWGATGWGDCVRMLATDFGSWNFMVGWYADSLNDGTLVLRAGDAPRGP